MASSLPLRRFGATFRFFRFVRAIRAQLAHTDGLIGCSLWAKPIAKRYWTLSVWRDEAALMTFMRSSPHAEVMKSLRTDMGPTTFVRWTVKAPTLSSRGTRRSGASTPSPLSSIVASDMGQLRRKCAAPAAYPDRCETEAAALLSESADRSRQTRLTPRGPCRGSSTLLILPSSSVTATSNPIASGSPQWRPT